MGATWGRSRELGGSLESKLSGLQVNAYEQSAEDVLTYQSNHNYKPHPPASILAELKKKYPGKTDEDYTHFYDAVISYFSLRGTAGGMETPEVLNFLHTMAYAKKAFDDHGSCVQYLTKIYQKYIDPKGAEAVNIEHDTRRELKSAFNAHNDWRNEHDPSQGSWKEAEDNVVRHAILGLQMSFENSPYGQAWKTTEVGQKWYAAQIAYDNNLLWTDNVYNDIYGDNNNQQAFIAYDDYRAPVDIPNYHHQMMGSYNAYVFTLMPLIIIGMVCLCVLIVIIVGIISFWGCYVFGRYQNQCIQFKRHNYENINEDDSDV